jgi:hypothetical protein
VATVQYYCTLDQLLADLDINGLDDYTAMIRHIESATQWLSGHDVLDGNFIPITKAIEYSGKNNSLMQISPVLGVPSVVLAGTTLTEGEDEDYIFKGKENSQPHWENGPFSKILRIDGTWPADDSNLAITAQHGKYLRLTTLAGESITLTDSEVIITVANGTKLSPGAHLKIEDEDIVVTGINGTVAATSLTDGAIAKGDEVITVDDASEFNQGEVIQIELEDLKIIKINTTTNQLAVIRGYNQTLITSTHVDDSAIGVYRKFDIERGINGTTAAAHNAKAVQQYHPPSDVVNLAIQLAALRYKKATTDFSGREANAQLGQTFYFSEFPKNVWQPIARNYIIQG